MLIRSYVSITSSSAGLKRGLSIIRKLSIVLAFSTYDVTVRSNTVLSSFKFFGKFKEFNFFIVNPDQAKKFISVENILWNVQVFLSKHVQ